MKLGSGRGATLVEVLIVGVAILILVSVILVIFRQGFGGAAGLDHEKAVKEAHQFAKDNGIDITGASCVNTDSDGDGYVSCTLSNKSAQGGVELLPIECAVSLSFNSGCKMQKAIGNFVRR